MNQSHKNIIIIGPAHPLRGGGMSTFNERLAKGFQDKGHTVTIYTFSLQYPSFLFPGSKQLSDEPAPEGLNIKVVINSMNPFNWIKIGNRIKKENPDLIVVRYWLPFMGPCLGTILRIAKKNKHSKVVCIADNVIPHEKRPGDKAFTKYFIKPVDAFIAMSENVLNDLHSFSTNKPAKYVPHPLYDNFGEKISKTAAREKLKIDNGQLIILFFGFIRKYKGLDFEKVVVVLQPQLRELARIPCEIRRCAPAALPLGIVREVRCLNVQIVAAQARGPSLFEAEDDLRVSAPVGERLSLQIARLFSTRRLPMA